MILTYESIAKKIDHALLLPTMTQAEMVVGCELARQYEVATVCIKPYAVPMAVDLLRDSDVRIGTVIGFPHGGQSTTCKLAESIEAIERGAQELDMVVNLGAVLGSDWQLVETEIQQVTKQAHQQHALIKVIFETCYLTGTQIVRLCQICAESNVDYVKTSTGFGTRGANDQDLLTMRQHLGAKMKLKASGGIKDLTTAIRYAELGCDRLGLSRTSEILDELIERLHITKRGVSRETPVNQAEQDY